MYTKKDAGYKSKCKTKWCKNCKHYVKDNKCTIVLGKVEPKGTCRYWRK